MILRLLKKYFLIDWTDYDYYDKIYIFSTTIKGFNKIKNKHYDLLCKALTVNLDVKTSDLIPENL